MGYSKEFVTALEFVWGDGFLSPGGPEEIAALIGDHDLRGARVLDIGSGLGGIDVILAEAYGAAELVGIDVSADLVAHARRLAEKRGLAERVSFQLIDPGPLPFADQSFDIVFSKDALVHVADKTTLFAEVMRVLRPGGQLIVSDWLWIPGAAENPLVSAWNAGNPLGFVYTTVSEARSALRAVGFSNIVMQDRTREIAARNRAEIARLEGPAMEELVAAVGEKLALDRLRSARGRQPVLDAAALIPTHLYGQRPARTSPGTVRL